MGLCKKAGGLSLATDAANTQPTEKLDYVAAGGAI